MTTLPRPPRHGTTHIIEIRLRELAQLFDSLDPSPFREKALDRSVEAYLLECAGEHGPGAPLAVRVHLPAGAGAAAVDIAEAIHAHFRLLHAQALRRHRRRMRIARAAILGGLLVLAAALLLRTLIPWGGTAGEVLAEGLLILAWVALWRPAEMALFDRWEDREQLRLLERLADVPVEAHCSADAT